MKKMVILNICFHGDFRLTFFIKYYLPQFFSEMFFWPTRGIEEHKFEVFDNPASIRRWRSVGLLSGQRPRRCANSKPTLGQRLMCADNA